jgi:hypothetical protein
MDLVEEKNKTTFECKQAKNMWACQERKKKKIKKI